MNWHLDFSTIGQFGLLGIVAASILKGWLVPRRVLVDAIALAESRVADARENTDKADAESEGWKQAYLAERRTNDVQARQITDLIEANKTAHAVLSAIPRAITQHD